LGSVLGQYLTEFRAANCAFASLKPGVESFDALVGELRAHVVKKIGSIVRPDAILITFMSE
jgi:acyl-coenzyme A synthetase/AMP-(fatty) acid ligase